MATIDQMNSYMTVYYSIKTGAIKHIFTGIQPMNTVYGEEAVEYSQIWAELVYPIDDNFILHWNKYKVDLTTLALVLIDQMPSAIDTTPQTPEQLLAELNVNTTLPDTANTNGDIINSTPVQ